ncbi:thiol reductant ABC exporter subunit CydD [Arthrobacter sp.]|uniref:thiol reductant ABC exporter subunit CydD n=1 Tax=Arthrobacter sp. TaxID=1667 RepID=UPI002810F6B0|nr:thiol reductant ABC exporter subunit CydD [Arthrobacter sp.]
MRPTFPSGPATRSAIYLLGLVAALKALSLVLMAQAVASVLAGLMAHDPAWGQQLTWGMAGVVLRSLTTWAQSVAARRAALGVKEQLRSELLERALRTGTRGAGPSDGGLAILATRGLDALDSYYTQFLPALVNCAAVPLLLGARILFADWISAAVIVLTVPLVPVFMVLIGRYTEDRVREAQTALARLSGHMLELAKGLPVLVGLGRATAQRKALEDISDEYRIRTMGTLRTAFLSALALELIATISVAVVAVFIGVRLVHGEMPLEAGLLALILAPDCYLPLRELGTAHHASDDGRAALAEATLVLDTPQAVPLDADHHRTDDDGAPPTVVVRDLEVVFSGRDTPAVAPLSFEAAAGSITALDGVSGAGKSTVLGVLAGMVGNSGSTRVLGEIAGFDRAGVAWVPQHPVMVAPTVQDEVELYLTAAHKGVLPDPDAVTESAERCLADVAAAHLADKHPAELSPGELRRVALARGLARIEAGATLLLLDEPTAHVDPETASVINCTILALRGRVTVVLVAHDPTTRQLADKIVQVAHEPGVRADSRKAEAPVAERPGGGLSSGTVSSAASSASSIGSLKRTSPIPAVTEGAGRGSTFQALRSLLAPEALKFTSSTMVGVLASLFAVALAGLSGWLIIRASEQPPILYLLTAIVGVRFFGIGRAVLRYCERLLLHDAVFAALTSLRGRLWESLSRRALAVRKLLQGGHVLGSVIDDVDTVRDLLPRVVLPPLTAIAVAAAAVLSTGLLLPAALPATAATALVSLVASPILALLADRMSSRTEQQLRTGVLRDVAAALDARLELQANHAAGLVLSAIRDADRAATAASLRSAWAEGLGQALTVLACGGAALISAVLAAPVVMAGAVEPATAAVVVLLQLALLEPYSAMASSVRQYPAFRSVLQRISGAGVLAGSDKEDPAGEDTPGVNRAGAAKTNDGLFPVPGRAGDRPGVELDGLTAAWPGGPSVFEELSAVAEPGTWLAVTGASGSGKSTLLSVILGFLPAGQGHVLVTGKVAWCPQEAHLFDSTIRGNLMLGLPGSENNRSKGEEAQGQIAETAMKAALTAAGLAPLMDRLAEGLDTRIGPSGSFLSGGERQRLAVARTLMAGADVILLDEPTAHLDAAAGRAMLADLRSGLKEKTVVLVSHNPADIHSTDHVIRLEEHAGRTTKPILARAGAGG